MICVCSPRFSPAPLPGVAGQGDFRSQTNDAWSPMVWYALSLILIEFVESPHLKIIVQGGAMQIFDAVSASLMVI